MSSLKKMPRLGKGIESLIPRNVLSNGRTIMNLPVTEIDVNPRQPRVYFNEEAIEQLVVSIKRIGVAQPIIVRRVERRYQIVAGERRFRASKKAGLQTVPVIIKQMNDEQSLELALIENLDREDLNAIEIAKGYQRLVDEFGYTHQKLADLFKCSRSAITNTLRLLNLPEEIQLALMKSEITQGHAKVLLGCKTEKMMMELYRRLIKENLSIKELEQDVEDERQVGKSPKKSQSEMIQPALFPELEKNLSRSFGVSVKMTGSKTKGRILIQYQTEEELNQILAAVKARK